MLTTSHATNESSNASGHAAVSSDLIVRQAFTGSVLLYGLYIQAMHMGDWYALPVYTIQPVCTVNDKVPSKELRDRLGIDYIIFVLQQNRLQWYGHVLKKEDTDWVKKCMEYEEGSRPRGRSKRTWRQVVQKDCQACKLNREDAMDRSRMEEADKGWMMIRILTG